jgi:hypothetical protein
VVSKLFDKLGFGSGDAVNKLDKLNYWFTANIPKRSDEVSTDLLPVWNDFGGITKDVKSNAKELGHDFTYMIGVLSGNKSLQTQTTDMQQFGTAIGDTVRWMAEFTHGTLFASKEVRTDCHDGLEFIWD